MPTILLEIDTADGLTKKSYVYANGEILMQHNGNYTTDKYFYLHDRLGSVREVIDDDGLVVRNYTFDAFGKTVEEGGTLTNPFMFTGQYFDFETGHYYLRARMYDPILMRFTARDPIIGKFEEPMTLHKYLYCNNNPSNLIDPTGNSALGYIVVGGTIGIVTAEIYKHHKAYKGIDYLTKEQATKISKTIKLLKECAKETGDPTIIKCLKTLNVSGTFKPGYYGESDSETRNGWLPFGWGNFTALSSDYFERCDVDYQLGTLLHESYHSYVEDFDTEDLYGFDDGYDYGGAAFDTLRNSIEKRRSKFESILDK